ncbi:MAG: hypothetical protein ACYTFO_05780 [Planctomycetota bacterium]|jgi:hypothetical protein
MPRRLSISLLIALFLMSLGLSSCTEIGALAYMFGVAEEDETIAAAYDDLPHSKVAVVIYADERTQYEYPGATLALSHMISSALRQNIENVETVDPVAIRAFQRENLGWETMDKASLGQALGANHVLFVALRQYATREPGSLNIYRGHINAEASIYDVTEVEGAPPVWQEEYLEVTFPPKATTGVVADNDRAIQYHTDRAFTDLLVAYFYEREVPKYQ